MANRESSNQQTTPGLDEISTRWPLIRDPVQFVMRYAPAIQKYLEVFLKNSHDADEVAQDFLLKGLQRGFLRTEQLHGRFRYYLKTAVRNAALNHVQRKRPISADIDASRLPDPHDPDAQAEQDWIAEWRRCVLDRAFQALEHHQRQLPGNLFYTVLRLTVDHPHEDSPALAVRASTLAARPVSAEAFRKQLSRARRLFAELLVAEVTQTLEQATPERIEEELAELGLLSHVRDCLPM